MTPLPETFEKDGYKMTQLRRVGLCVLLLAEWLDGKQIPGFIVAKIIQTKGGLRQFPNGTSVHYDPKETICGETGYGKQAWFERDRGRADVIFEKLVFGD